MAGRCPDDPARPGGAVRGGAAALVVLAGVVAARRTVGFEEAVLQRARPGVNGRRNTRSWGAGHGSSRRLTRWVARSEHLAACCALFVNASLATTRGVRWWSVLVSAVVTGWMAYVMISATESS